MRAPLLILIYLLATTQDPIVGTVSKGLFLLIFVYFEKSD